MKVGDLVKFTYQWVDTLQPVTPVLYYECGVVCETSGTMVSYFVTNCEPDNRFGTLGKKVANYTEDLEMISESR